MGPTATAQLIIMLGSLLVGHSACGSKEKGHTTSPSCCFPIMTSAGWTHRPSRELIKEKYMSANWLSPSTVRYFWFSAAQIGCLGNSYRAVTKLSNETFQQKVISALVSHRAMGKRGLLAQNLFIDSRNQISEPTVLYVWVKRKSWYWSSMTTSFCFPSENSAEQVYSVSDNTEQRRGARTAKRVQGSNRTLQQRLGQERWGFSTDRGS